VTPTDYLRGILRREAVDNGPGSRLRALEDNVVALCRDWADRHLLEVFPGGAFEKGTANLSGTAIDFVVSLAPDTPFTVAEIYQSLFDALEAAGLEPAWSSVGIAVRFGETRVDLLPARRESLAGDFHQLLSVRRERPITTDLGQQVREVAGSGRTAEIRALKLWRDQHGLDLPSYYLERTVLAALRSAPQGTLAENVWAVLGYLQSLFVARAVIDPANALNIVSDELTGDEKQAVRAAAAQARDGRPWSEIIR
jgi:hypothetical protein